MVQRPKNPTSADPDKKGWCIARANFSYNAILNGKNVDYSIEALITNFCYSPDDDHEYAHIPIPVGATYRGIYGRGPGVLNLELDDFDNGRQFVVEAQRAANSNGLDAMERTDKNRTQVQLDGEKQWFWYLGLCDCFPQIDVKSMVFTSTQPAYLDTLTGTYSIPSGQNMTAAILSAIQLEGIPGCCN